MTGFKFYYILITLNWSRVFIMMIDKLMQEMFPYSPFKMTSHFRTSFTIP